MQQEVSDAASIIREGEIVGFPTETVYGLGANALDANAVKKIFIAKGRPADNPLIVHVSNTQQLHNVVRSIPPLARKLIRKYWPGPLTILFPRHPDLPYEVTAGLDTVAVRMPANDIALALIEASQCPIAAPSANRSGRPSPTRAEHVKEDFPTLMVLDGGACAHGVESTVIDIDRRPRLLRLGAIPLEKLQEDIEGLVVAHGTIDKPASPGMKYTHYAPKQPLYLFEHSSIREMQAHVEENPKATVLCKEQYIAKFPGSTVISLGLTDEDAARTLFHALRTAQGESIAVLGVKRKGHGRAVMDRLEKAAKEVHKGKVND